MSSQAIADIALAMRKAVDRHEQDTESDKEPVDMVSNRGNKLHKRAKYVHEGQLAPTSSTRMHKESVLYGEGQYRRNIISHVPRLFDEDGYELDPEDEDDERLELAQAEAADLYPYAGIQIESLLAPLTAAGELTIHPTLQKPFTSPILSHLTENASSMLHKERASLWNLKHLLTRLGGDHSWIPTGMMEGQNDLALFPDGREVIRENLYSKEPYVREEELPEFQPVAGEINDFIDLHPDAQEEATQLRIKGVESEIPESEEKEGEPIIDGARTPEDYPMEDAPVRTPIVAPIGSPIAPVFSPISPIQVAGDSVIEDSAEKIAEASDPIKNELEPDPDETLADDSTILEDEEAAQTNGKTYGDHPMIDDIGTDGDGQDDEAPSPRRMRTRAQVAATTDSNRSPSPSSSTSSYIDPYFLPPQASIPSRHLGLPPDESNDVRRILQLYIQKQEEVVRGCERIYSNLLKADRLRKEVYGWAKQESHVGEMSDGEDWYDPDDWGLNGEELRKGQDEEEEQDVGEGKGGKKTRARRQ